MSKSLASLPLQLGNLLHEDSLLYLFLYPATSLQMNMSLLFSVPRQLGAYEPCLRCGPFEAATYANNTHHALRILALSTYAQYLKGRDERPKDQRVINCMMCGCLT